MTFATPMKFLVTGLPRSRTAWLSVLLNRDRCACSHELSLRDPDLATLAEFDPNNFDAVGTCDSLAPLTIAAFGGRLVIVERPRHEVSVSLAKMGQCQPGQFEQFLLVLLARIEALAEHSETLRVRFHDLGKYETVNRLWQFVGNPAPLSRELFEQLNALRIIKVEGEGSEVFGQSTPQFRARAVATIAGHARALAL